MVIELVSMAPTGEAIGRHEGLVIFVPYGMPGDLVDVELDYKRRNFARARILNIVRPSSMRSQPRCVYFQTCGGCEWQHISYEQQLSFKTQSVREQLSRIGKFQDAVVEDCIPSPSPYYYRNHTQFVLSPNGLPGYRAAGTRTVVEVNHCPIISPTLNERVEELSQGRSHSPNPYPDLFRMLDTTINGEIHLRASVNLDKQTAFVTEEDGDIRLLNGDGVIHERVGSYTYRISPGSFFQINTAVAELLVAQVMKVLDLQGHEDILDMYCGVGLFTAPIAAQAHYVLGIEASPLATADAASNLNSFANAAIMTSDVLESLTLPAVSRYWHAVVVDPPRAGIEYYALMGLMHLKPGKLVYISCDPATLARDARIICNGGYHLSVVQPLDMFPQTHHVETIAVFIQSPDA